MSSQSTDPDPLIDEPGDDVPAEKTVAPRWPPRGVEVAIICGYLLLALWVMKELWADPAHLNPETNTTDPAFFEWALVHATRIFTHGENPFFSTRLNAPLGVSMIANTGLLGLTVPLVPMTLLFGPSVSLVLLLTLGLASTAAAWYFVFSRHLLTGRDGYSLGGAALGGLFCGFAPGMVNHANAHPNLIAQFLIPLIVWRILDAARNPGRYLRRGVVLGLLVTWQAFLNEELLFLTALAVLLFVAGYAVWRPREVRAGVRPLLAVAGIGALTAGVLLAGPLYLQFLGPGHYRGLPDFVLGYGTDLGSYPAFAKLSLVAGDGKLANQPEENSFLGWPLLIVLVMSVAWLWRRPAVRSLALVGLVFGVLSLGQTVNYKGHQVSTHGPWGWLNKLPLFDTVVPTRLSLVLIPIVGVLLAYVVDDLRTVPVAGRYAWLVALAVALVPIAPRELPVTSRPPTPYFFTSGDWKRYVHGDEAVVSADQTVWNGGIDAMHWDNATGQGYLAVGGYFLGPDDKGKGTYGQQYRPTSAMLFYVAAGQGVPQLGEQQRIQLAQDVTYWHAAIFVLAPTSPHWADLNATLNTLIGPGETVDDVRVWNVRELRTT